MRVASTLVWKPLIGLVEREKTLGYGPIERKLGIGRIAGHSYNIIGDQGEVSQDTGDRGGLEPSKMAMDLGEQKDERCKLAAFERASCHLEVQRTKDLDKLVGQLGEATVGGIMALDPRCTPGRKPTQFFQFPQVPQGLSQTWRAVPYPGYNLCKQWRLAAHTW